MAVVLEYFEADGHEMSYIGRKPHWATEGAAGLDLYADFGTSLAPGERRLVKTGTSVAIPDDHFGLLAIRSSLGARGVSLSNGVGIIDSDYRGEISVAIHNGTQEWVKLAEGERIAQLIILPFTQVLLRKVVAFDVTDRGEGGFGSTGRA